MDIVDRVALGEKEVQVSVSGERVQLSGVEKTSCFRIRQR